MFNVIIVSDNDGLFWLFSQGIEMDSQIGPTRERSGRNR
jgi:hypothetical protein